MPPWLSALRFALGLLAVLSAATLVGLLAKWLRDETRAHVETRLELERWRTTAERLLDEVKSYRKTSVWRQ